MHKDPAARREYLKRYRQTEAGKASRARYIESRRGEQPLRINPLPLARAVAQWRTN